MKMPMSLRKQVRPAVVAVLALASAGAIAGDTPALTHKDGLLVLPNVTVAHAPVAASEGAVASSGARMVKDKDTGRLRAPTAEEVEALTVPASDEAVVTRQLPNGAVEATGLDAFAAFSVVRKSEDGKISAECVTGETAAQHALHSRVEVTNDR